jgi:polar amino acid transport system substrate-binding protein
MAKNLTVGRAPSVNAAFQQLANGQADYLIIGLYPGLAKARELRLLNRVKPLQHQLLSEPMYVAFSKKSACRQYQAEFGKQLRQMISHGRVQPLLTQAERQWEAERVQWELQNNDTACHLGKQ